ncbi:DUF2971 domain-containing protein [Vibrio aestuarianus]|uniref:DUF2971 domain-containing protein n=1 Tax=Vibrio aestuarianus TaxID=28171 RepID=UPI00237C52F0|nr:DUF2971 domain-containing protein [Vibrio aestuarianus]MDE1352188.1 DUF2971 domain-containing protein [Vibrio aestuarianus]
MVLWHYTSTDVLSAIFSAGKPTLRASHINFLNDSVELRHGLEAIKSISPNIDGYTPEQISQVIDNLLNENYDPNLYSFSLSEAEDSLYQWLAYCPRERGIALGFEFTDNLIEVGIPHIDNTFSLPLVEIDQHQIPKYRKCYYFSSYDEIDSSWFIWNSQKNLAPQLLTNAMFLKHSAFHFEKEHRLFFHPMANSLMYVPAKFFGSKPYIEFNFEKEALKYIYVSPRGDKEVTERLVRKMLSTFGLNHIVVKVSEIPFRE